MTRWVLKYIAFLLFVTSCSINGNFKGLYGYYDKTLNECPDVFKLEVEISEETVLNENRVIVLNGKQLLSLIEMEPKALIYLWAPNCTGEECMDINALQQKCNETGDVLFVVAEYYDCDMMRKSYNLEHSIIGVDTEYYRSRLTSKYLEKFFDDLNIDEAEKRLHYMSYGKVLEEMYSMNGN